MGIYTTDRKYCCLFLVESEEAALEKRRGINFITVGERGS